MIELKPIAVKLVKTGEIVAVEEGDLPQEILHRPDRFLAQTIERKETIFTDRDKWVPYLHVCSIKKDSNPAESKEVNYMFTDIYFENELKATVRTNEDCKLMFEFTSIYTKRESIVISHIKQLNY